MDGKSWWTSKTLWASVAFAVIGIIQYLTSTAGPDGGPLIPVEWNRPLLIVGGAAFYILRVLTDKPLLPLDPPTNGGGKLKTFLFAVVFAVALLCIPAISEAGPVRNLLRAQPVRSVLRARPVRGLLQAQPVRRLAGGIFRRGC